MMEDEDLREMRTDIKKLLQQQSNLLGHFDSHVKDKDRHQLPPCDAHKTLVARLWALAAGVLASFGIGIWNALKAH